MKMPNGYSDVQARTGAREQLPAGGYVCRIRGAREETNSGYWQLVIAFDVHEGEKAGIFDRRYKDDVQDVYKRQPHILASVSTGNAAHSRASSSDIKRSAANRSA